MFSTYLFAMPSNKDIDYCIDLELGTFSISFPSYIVAPEVLREPNVMSRHNSCHFKHLNRAEGSRALKRFIEDSRPF